MNRADVRFLELVQKHGLSKHLDFLRSRALPCAGLVATACDDDKIPAGNSKLGGCPDVPHDFRWPMFKDRPLSFLAQINLSTVPEFSRGPLPPAGLLQFYYDYDSWGGDPFKTDFFKVLYFDVPLESLKRAESPPMPDKKILFGMFSFPGKVMQYKPCLISFEESWSLPGEFDEITATDELSDAYYELLEDLGAHHRLLGHSEPIQSPMDIECELTSLGKDWAYYSGLGEDARKEFDVQARKWKLLFQLDSDTENSDMMWGDAGRLYFFLHEDSLAAHRFEDTWLTVQCY